MRLESAQTDDMRGPMVNHVSILNSKLITWLYIDRRSQSTDALLTTTRPPKTIAPPQHKKIN